MSCNCNKPKCDGKCGISPSVLQINNPGDCTLFHRVEVPASMGDSKTNPPKNGDYRNVLLYYVADGTSWFFSSDGVPQKLVSGFTDYDDAINLPQINGHTLIRNKTSEELGLVSQEDLNSLTSEISVSFMALEDGETTDGTHKLGDCAVIVGKENILIDLGGQSTCANLINYLVTNGISKIDKVVISHYHGDHIGANRAQGLEALLDSAIDFSSCVFYLPHKGIEWTSMYGYSSLSYVRDNEAAVKNILNSHNIAYVEPDNEQEVVIDENTKLRFYNIGDSFYEHYYDKNINWNMQTLSFCVYNNFSMITELDYSGHKFMFTGDIEYDAQEQLYEYFKDIDVLKVEHHGLNYRSSDKYLAQLNPDYAVICDIDPLNADGLARNTVYRLINKRTSLYRTWNGVVTIKANSLSVSAQAKEAFEIYNMSDNLYEGQPILSGTDLNDLVTPGTYYSRNATTSQSLANSPVSGSGFKLTVERQTEDSEKINQTLMRSNTEQCTIYTRNFHDGSWGGWGRIEPAQTLFRSWDSSEWDAKKDITFSSGWTEQRFSILNGTLTLNLQFVANEDLGSYQDIIAFPKTNDNYSFQPRTNWIIDFALFDPSGNVYPAYLTTRPNDETGYVTLRLRKAIPHGTTVYGNCASVYST